MQRLATSQNTITGLGLSPTDRNFLTFYQWKVGSILMPQYRVECMSPSLPFRELLRFWHATTLQEVASLHNRTSYTLDATSADPVTEINEDNPQSIIGSFHIGQEMESFANKSDVIMSGISTLGQNIFFQGEFDGNNTAATMDTFALFDTLFTISEGTMTSQY